ncbi:MAG: fatty acid desaturase [Bacteroidia bacterium]
MEGKIRFTDKTNKNFQSTLKTRVDSYFSDKNISSKANGFMHFKSILYLGILLGLYFTLLFANLGTAGTFLVFTLIGLSIAMVGINVCHDAIHGAYSDKKWVNKLMSMPFNLIGASVYMWKIMHNMVHHTCILILKDMMKTLRLYQF